MVVERESEEKDWNEILILIEKFIGKKPADLNEVLYLIGIQELGKGIKNFTKEQKQDLMHIATCKVLSYSGYYEIEGLDQEGWPHWKNVKKVPSLKVDEQEKFIKAHVVEYFNREFQWKL